MPSVTTYTPYEKLAFFQSVAKHGTDALAFQDISTALSQNEFIRKNNNVERLSAEALQGLYEELINVERQAGATKINGTGENGERSPKRRKLSASSASNNGGESGEQQIVRALVDRLYTRYKEEIMQDIKREEEDYARLQDEIKTLENEVDAHTKASAQTPASASTNQDVQHDQILSAKILRDTPKSDGPASLAASVLSGADFKRSDQRHSSQPPTQPSPRHEHILHSQTGQSHPSPAPSQSVSATPRPSAPQRKGSQALSSTSAHQSPNMFNRTLPPPSPQRPNYGPVQTQPGFTPLPQGQTIPQMSSVQQRPSPIRQGSNQGRGSPIPPQGQHPYPSYQPYPPPQWHHGAVPGQFQQHPGYGPAPQFYPQPPPGRYASQTPQQSPYQAYPHAPPVQYPPPPQGWRGQQFPSHSGSAVSTPISRSSSRVTAPRSESSTPWKKRKDMGLLRPPSPARPEREVSPLTDKESSDTEPTSRKTKKNSPSVQKKTEQDKISPQHPSRTSRRGRPPSKTPSAIAPSRSQSIVSHGSDDTNERIVTSKRASKIKAEPPSTPLPPPSDSEQQQRSSGRRGRLRNNTVTSHPDLSRTVTIKRKRDSPSPTSSVRSPIATSTSQNPPAAHDPSLVVVSKNFSKTSLLLLNEITSHKLAGIFAKPLSERDAPGYKDLVLRPQDLKSIRAAISRGSKAALPVIEALETGDEEAAPSTRQTNSTSATIGSIGNGFYLVRKTEDLLPPRAIVNSSQLEMELVRMFANAVMFNPLPTSERGFGRSLRLRRNGGDIDPNSDVDEVSVSEQEGSDGDSRAGGTGWDEGGIISDAREMFEDVATTVSKWRGLEGERMAAAFATPSTFRPGETANMTGRQGSVSIGSALGEDDVTTNEREETATPVPIGTARKRRRIAEH